MPDITQLARLHATPERVYQAITTVEGIRSWWTRDALFESKVGGTAEVGFFNHRVVTRMDDDRRRSDPKVPAIANWHSAYIDSFSGSPRRVRQGHEGTGEAR